MKKMMERPVDDEGRIEIREEDFDRQKEAVGEKEEARPHCKKTSGAANDRRFSAPFEQRSANAKKRYRKSIVTMPGKGRLGDLFPSGNHIITRYTFNEKELRLLARMAEVIAVINREDDEFRRRRWGRDRSRRETDLEHSPAYQEAKRNLSEMVLSAAGMIIIHVFVSVFHDETGRKYISVPDAWEEPARFLMSSRGDLLRAYDAIVCEVLAGRLACPKSILNRIECYWERYGKERLSVFLGTFDLDRFQKANSRFSRINPCHTISEEEAIQKYCATDSKEVNELVARLAFGLIIKAFPDIPEPEVGINQYQRVHCKAKKRIGKTENVWWGCCCTDQDGYLFDMKDESSDCICYNMEWKQVPLKLGPCDSEEFDDEKAVMALIREWEAIGWKPDLSPKKRLFFGSAPRQEDNEKI